MAGSINSEGGYMELEEFLVKQGLKHDSLTAMDPLRKFLAQYGIKGMRWGFRRQRGSDGTVSGGVEEGTAGPGVRSGASVKGDSDADMAIDALRVVKTTQKKSHQMSDREIKEANARADAIRRYNELFGPPDPNKELAIKVARLRLEKDFAKLNAELHPSMTARIGRLIKASAPLFKAVSGQLSAKPTQRIMDSLVKEFGPAFKAANAVKNQPTGTNASKAAGPRKASFNKNPGFTDRSGPNSVFNVTNVGRPGTTYGDPTVPELLRRR